MEWILEYFFQLTPHLEHLLGEAQLPARFAFPVAVALPAFLWVGVAFWGAVRAESAGLSFCVHFALGMVLPLIHSLVFVPALVHARRRRLKANRTQKDAEAKARRIPFKQRHRTMGRFVEQEKLKGDEGAESPDFPMGAAACVRYFSSLERRQSEREGVRLAIEYGDGESLEVERIMETLPQAIVVQTWSDAMKRAQSVRIPYATITRVQVL